MDGSRTDKIDPPATAGAGPLGRRTAVRALGVAGVALAAALGLAGGDAALAGRRKRRRKKCKRGRTRCGDRCVRGRCCPGKACGNGGCRCIVAVEGDAFCAVDGESLIDPCAGSADCGPGLRCVPSGVVSTCVAACGAV